jgi:hypothetical protein
LKNEEGFYLDAAVPFGFKVTNMKELRRSEEDLPSLNQIKQLNTCWKEKVKKLEYHYPSMQPIHNKERIIIQRVD